MDISGALTRLERDQPVYQTKTDHAKRLKGLMVLTSCIVSSFVKGQKFSPTTTMQEHLEGSSRAFATTIQAHEMSLQMGRILRGLSNQQLEGSDAQKRLHAAVEKDERAIANEKLILRYIQLIHPLILEMAPGFVCVSRNTGQVAPENETVRWQPACLEAIRRNIVHREDFGIHAMRDTSFTLEHMLQLFSLGFEMQPSWPSTLPGSLVRTIALATLRLGDPILLQDFPDFEDSRFFLEEPLDTLQSLGYQIVNAKEAQEKDVVVYLNEDGKLVILGVLDQEGKVVSNWEDPPTDLCMGEVVHDIDAVPSFYGKTICILRKKSLRERISRDQECQVLSCGSGMVSFFQNRVSTYIAQLLDQARGPKIEEYLARVGREVSDAFNRLGVRVETERLEERGIIIEEVTTLVSEHIKGKF